MITYRVDHDSVLGWPIIVKVYGNGSEQSQSPTADGSGPLRAEFDIWNATQLPSLVVAIVAPVIIPTPVSDYASPFVSNLLLWGRIHKALDDARFPFVVVGNTQATILTNLKAQVTDVVAVILTAPQGVINEFQKERTLQGSTVALPGGIAGLTAAGIPELRILVNVARQIANQGLAIASAFNSLNG